MWFANANSILGNVKWHYNTVVNVLPRIEMIAVNEWWWSTSCEWADVVFAVDSWAELKHPDMTASVTNPFLQVFPRTPLKRIFDTIGDIEVLAEVGEALARQTGDQRFTDCWKFVREGRTDVYLQRILDSSANAKGYHIEDLEAKAKDGVPALMMNRTSPKAVGLRAGDTTRGPGTRRPGGSSSTARRTSSSRPARTCRCTASRSTRRSTSRTSSWLAPHEALRPAGPERLRRRARRSVVRDAPGAQRRQDLGETSGRRRIR